ncbi:toprim domain-containing protein [Xanthobacter sp. TB0136]|uniref:toprim domain-containing protein n=1 Tax=Xanthobacter sp. TB0136 TaxID=3459177 RepID=UPI0040397A9A
MSQSLHSAMVAACDAVRVTPPSRALVPGRWTQTDTYERNGKGDGRVLLFDDGMGGIVWNHQTQTSQNFSIRDQGGDAVSHAPKPDPMREKRRREEASIVESICASIVRSCRNDMHPYLERKGFPDECGLVHDDPRQLMPRTRFGDVLRSAMPETDGPVLIVPGRIGKVITTVQFITADGDKKNIFRGRMGGASHRIATGRRTIVCEGIATALSVRAALRLLGQNWTVLSAYSASNAAKVAASIPDAVVAADHDKPVPVFNGLGTGEHFARQSGCVWTMPPEMGDFNDMHMAHGLRAVALHLREVMVL